jgi:hypothetical protein
MDDAKLKDLLGAGTPPAADPRFVMAVMARIEHRRFRREMATTAGLAALAALMLALLAPTLEIAWDLSFAPFASNLVIGMLLLAVTITVPRFFSAGRD